MSFREKRICKRCGTSIIYTNEVELALWESRPGCPACTKTRKPGRGDEGGYEDEAPDRESPQGIAALFEWVHAERQAVNMMRLNGIITLDEAVELEQEIITAARAMMELDPL